MSHAFDWVTPWRVTAVAGIALALWGGSAVVRWLDEGSSMVDQFRTRLVAGVPWGTLLVSGLLVCVYLFVQRGASSWGEPLTIPFRSWSYHHPVGILLSPFAHSGPGHLVDNVTSTLVFGSLAEIAVGHYPTGATESGDRWRDDPRLRALVGWPSAVVLFGVLVSFVAWGPTMGFSGVVFAFAGLALVHYPVWTALGLLGTGLLETTFRAVADPVVIASGSVGGGQPWWADVAIGSHVFGLLAGALLGSLLLARRDPTHHPSARRTWLGTLLLGSGLTVWAIWWARPGGQVLLRGVGLPFLFVLASVVTVGSRAIAGQVPGGDAPRARRVGITLFLVPLVAMAAVAVPLKATSGVTVPGNDGVTVDGYTVTYVESVPNQRLATLGAVTGNEPVSTSGVVVVDPDRGIWTRVLSSRALARDGTRSVEIGGLGWARSVYLVRDGWQTTGGGSVYTVQVHPEDGLYHRVFASGSATARPIVDGRSVTIRVTSDSFAVVVKRDNRTIGTAPVPDFGGNVTVGGLTVHHVDDRLVVATNDTRVTVARGG